MGFKAPKVPANQQVYAPPPTPAQYNPVQSPKTPNLGGTFITQQMPSAPPLTKNRKSLLGQ